MTLFGVDGSKWNTNQPTEADWASIGFLLWRASIGRTVDATYGKWRDAARANDKPFCAYHFVWQQTQQPNTTSPGIPAGEQAATFALAEPDLSVPVMLDWEQSEYTASDGTRKVSSAALFSDVVAVAEALRALGYRVPLVYSGEWYWKNKGTPDMTGQGLELVNSNYGKQTAASYDAEARYVELGGDDSTRWAVTYGGLSPIMWQFSDRVRWSGTADDMNAIRDPATVVYYFKDWTPMAASEGDAYPYAYDGSTRTMAQLEASKTVSKLHPEMWRRAKALMVKAKAEGVPLGVGTGWRIQPVNPDGTAKPGFALPGNSNHEGFPADGVAGGAVAIDAVGDLAWMESHLKEYGLRSFINVNDEPWHVQPAEIPASRNRRVEPWVLETFPLPDDKPPEVVDVTLDAEDLAAVAQAVWQQQFTAGTTGAKAAGWILGQTYGLAQRDVKASEAPITNAEIARIATAVAATVTGGATPEVIAVAVADELARRAVA